MGQPVQKWTRSSSFGPYCHLSAFESQRILLSFKIAFAHFEIFGLEYRSSFMFVASGESPLPLRPRKSFFSCFVHLIGAETDLLFIWKCKIFEFPQHLELENIACQLYIQKPDGARWHPQAKAQKRHHIFPKKKKKKGIWLCLVESVSHCLRRVWSPDAVNDSVSSRQGPLDEEAAGGPSAACVCWLIFWFQAGRLQTWVETSTTMQKQHSTACAGGEMFACVKKSNT